MDDKERHARGMSVRRKVLGNAWVGKANAAKTAFNAEFQDMITRNVWGGIWTRPTRATSRPTRGGSFLIPAAAAAACNVLTANSIRAPSLLSRKTS